MKQLFILTLLGLSLMGCGTHETDITANWTAERFYHESQAAMSAGNFSTAIEYLETLESRFPFGRFATQAQLNIIYAYYEFGEADAAIASAERFMKLNPKHPNVDYAYYIKGLANFNRGGTILDLIQERDISQFDATLMNRSYNDLSTLVRLFPKSRYSHDAKQRLNFLRNNLAQSELNIAKYYQSREAWAAAANRVKVILQEYQGSSVIREALDIQLHAYQQLGFDQLAHDVERIIEINFGT